MRIPSQDAGNGKTTRSRCVHLATYCRPSVSEKLGRWRRCQTAGMRSPSTSNCRCPSSTKTKKNKKNSHRVAGAMTGTIAAIICRDWLRRYSQIDTTVHCEKKLTCTEAEQEKRPKAGRCEHVIYRIWGYSVHSKIKIL